MFPKVKSSYKAKFPQNLYNYFSTIYLLKSCEKLTCFAKSTRFFGGVNFFIQPPAGNKPPTHPTTEPLNASRLGDDAPEEIPETPWRLRFAFNSWSLKMLAFCCLIRNPPFLEGMDLYFQVPWFVSFSLFQGSIFRGRFFRVFGWVVWLLFCCVWWIPLIDWWEWDWPVKEKATHISQVQHRFDMSSIFWSRPPSFRNGDDVGTLRGERSRI